MIGYYSSEELESLNFKKVGDNVRISKSATVYNCGNIAIGSNVRIDNFCVIALSGNGELLIGNNVHIGAQSFLNGLGNIILQDYVTLAPGCRIFSSTDDYSGEYMSGATLPPQFLGTVSAEVVLKKHTLIGTNVSIMPGVILETGTAVAAHSFVNKSTTAFDIVGGVPAKYIKKRSEKLLDLERRYKEYQS